MTSEKLGRSVDAALTPVFVLSATKIAAESTISRAFTFLYFIYPVLLSYPFSCFSSPARGAAAAPVLLSSGAAVPRRSPPDLRVLLRLHAGYEGAVGHPGFLCRPADGIQLLDGYLMFSIPIHHSLISVLS